MKSARTTKKTTLSASAPQKHVVERPAKPLPPKIVGELPVPTVTFFL